MLAAVRCQDALWSCLPISRKFTSLFIGLAASDTSISATMLVTIIGARFVACRVTERRARDSILAARSARKTAVIANSLCIMLHYHVVM
jgi:hypothetical protein